MITKLKVRKGTDIKLKKMKKKVLLLAVTLTSIGTLAPKLEEDEIGNFCSTQIKFEKNLLSYVIIFY